jgi:hypothetical protein
MAINSEMCNFEIKLKFQNKETIGCIYYIYPPKIMCILAVNVNVKYLTAFY